MEQEEKLLLLGPGRAGKTCMRSIIFDNYFPRDALRLGITISMDQTRVHILRNLFLNLLDGGGQHQYVVDYLNKQREYTFRNVAVMLFVFDFCSLSKGDLADSEASELYKPIVSSDDWTKSDMLHYFGETMRNIRKYSPLAKVFVLLHKADLIHKSHVEQLFRDRKIEILGVVQELQNEDGPNAVDFPEIQFFCTSIWSDSLYLAYSSVVRSLIPHRHRLVQAIESLGRACRAVEVALYERSTFLCLAHVTRRHTSQKKDGDLDANQNPEDSSGHLHDDGDDGHRYRSGKGDLRMAEVSETVKHFKLRCMNNSTSLDGFTVDTDEFVAILTPFTEYVHVLMVCDDPSISPELHRININAARHQFQCFLNSGDPEAAAMRNVL